VDSRRPSRAWAIAASIRPQIAAPSAAVASAGDAGAAGLRGMEPPQPAAAIRDASVVAATRTVRGMVA
jgi:hypothetical protein